MANQQTLDSSPSPPQSDDPSLSRTPSSSRLNADAPEFVPNRTMPTMMIPPPPPPPPPGLLHMYHHPPPPFRIPIHFPPHLIPYGSYPYPHRNHQSRGEKEADSTVKKGDYERRREYKRDSKKGLSENGDSGGIDAKSGLPEDTVKKIVKQVEYYFSDINLATTVHLMRFISIDPEGYVPMHVVASFNKVKTLINCDSQLAAVLQNSSMLVVSEDEKKVKRMYPITESALEELQSRIVIAENLPEDHCYKNLLKIFSSVGSVKNIRTCEPQNPGSGPPSAARSAKNDLSNKVHAFVEYEIVEVAEKAVVELNEGSWKSGLRVRLMLQHQDQRNGHKHVQGRGRKEEDDVTTTSDQQTDDKHFEDLNDNVQELTVGEEEQGGDKVNGGQRKGHNRGRGKGRGRSQNLQNQNLNHNGSGNHHSSNHPINNTEQPSMANHQQQPAPGPRMPDGSRGFSLGRGKPVTVHAD